MKILILCLLFVGCGRECKVYNAGPYGASVSFSKNFFGTGLRTLDGYDPKEANAFCLNYLGLNEKGEEIESK